MFSEFGYCRLEYWWPAVRQSTISTSWCHICRALAHPARKLASQEWLRLASAEPACRRWRACTAASFLQRSPDPGAAKALGKACVCRQYLQQTDKLSAEPTEVSPLTCSPPFCCSSNWTSSQLSKRSSQCLLTSLCEIFKGCICQLMMTVQPSPQLASSAEN